MSTERRVHRGRLRVGPEALVALATVAIAEATLIVLAVIFVWKGAGS